MKHQQDPFAKAFGTLKNAALPTEAQKGKMLHQVLLESRLDDDTVLSKLRKWIAVYPWRFAFGVSTAQAIVFTLVFGTGYTNLMLRFFGG